MVDESIKINLKDPNTLGVLEEMGKSLEEARSEKKHPKEKLVFEGTLKSIPSLETVIEYGNNGIIGPGYSSWPISSNPEITLRVEKDQKTQDFVYDGVILTDSIGNDIQIYMKNNIVSRIYDKTLDRTYKIKD